MFAYRHSPQIIETVKEYQRVRDEIKSTIGYILFVKKDVLPQEGINQHDARSIIKDQGITSEDLLDKIINLMFQHNNLGRFDEGRGRTIKSYLNQSIRFSLDTIRFEGQSFFPRHQKVSATVVKKTKSGKTIGTMQDYLDEVLAEPAPKPVPKPKTAEEEYCDQLDFFIAGT